MKALVKSEPRFNINEVRIIVAIERAIARLTATPDLAEHLVFKGGFVVQTLFDRGSANSRAKDVYDLVYLFPRCKDRGALMAAVRRTFENRETRLPESFVKQVNQIDNTILSHGWPGVKILQEKPDFESAWETLIKHLKGLDDLAL